MSKNQQSPGNVARVDIVGKQPRPVWLMATTVGMLLIVTGVLVPIFQASTVGYGMMSPWFKYVYAAGALLVLLGRIFGPYTGKVVRVKRLFRIELWAALFFCVAAFFMFYDTDTTRNWIAFTLAGGAVQIYSSLMIPREINKALRASSRKKP